MDFHERLESNNFYRPKTILDCQAINITCKITNSEVMFSKTKSISFKVLTPSFNVVFMIGESSVRNRPCINLILHVTKTNSAAFNWPLKFNSRSYLEIINVDAKNNLKVYLERLYRQSVIFYEPSSFEPLQTITFVDIFDPKLLYTSGFYQNKSLTVKINMFQ